MLKLILKVIMTLMAGFVTLITVNFGHGDTAINSFANSIYIVFQFVTNIHFCLRLNKTSLSDYSISKSLIVLILHWQNLIFLCFTLFSN